MSAHTHPCCVCETVEVACDRPVYDASAPPQRLRLRVCERCRAHHDALNGDRLFLLLRQAVRRCWWCNHDAECSRSPCEYAFAPCGVETRTDDGGLPDDCTCGRDDNELDAREAMELRIAELTHKETP